MTELPLAGRVAAVTGGAGGIGRAIVAALRAAGATAISLDLAASSDPAAVSIGCDVREDPSVEAAIRMIADVHGRLDLVIHAAGIARDAVIWKLPVAEWDQVHQVNLRGAFLLLRHAIPEMRRGGGGRIVLIGSINGSRGKRGRPRTRRARRGCSASPGA